MTPAPLVKIWSMLKCRRVKIHIQAIFFQERYKAEILNKRLRRQLAEYKVPPVLNYVHEKIAVHELENTIKIWERKVEIAQVWVSSH